MDKPAYLKIARAQWRWRGNEHPLFAEKPKQGQISVWDFPRPPELIRDQREIMVRWGKTLVAQTRGAWAVRETSHPPTFYLPMSDVKAALLKPAGLNCTHRHTRFIGFKVRLTDVELRLNQ